jgi:hypothetical protein
MISGHFLPSEIWVNLLTPERAAAIERSYQEQRREERRRIDARFAPRTDTERRSQKFSAAPKPKMSLAEFDRQCNRIIRAMERLAVRRNQKNLLNWILE